MIRYPITRRDLLRSVMAQCPAAGVVYHDEQLARFAADSTKGLCSFRIVREPEVKTIDRQYDINRDEWREVVTTTQHHHVEVCYHNPEDEFEIKLSIEHYTPEALNKFNKQH